MAAVTSRRQPLRKQANLLVLGVCYFLVAGFTIRFTRFDGGVAFVWAGTALLLADLTVVPPSRWAPRVAICAAGGIVATALWGLGPVIAIPVTIVNMVEAIGVAWLLRRFYPDVGEFNSIAEVAGFIAIAGIVGPAVTAFAGAACAWAVTKTAYWPNWLNWFTAHTLGTIIFAPLLTLCRTGEPLTVARARGRRGVMGAAGLLAVLVAVTVFVFSQTRWPLLFLPFLPMMIAVFRLGRFGAVVSSVILATIGSALTLRGLGPIGLAEGAMGAKAQFFQFYLAVAVLMALPAAAELKQRKNLFARLQQTSALQHLILDRTSDIIMRLEIDGTITYVSPSIQRLAGYAPERLIGRTPQELIHPDDFEAVTRVHRQALASPNDTFIVEYRGLRENGEPGWFESHTRATVNEAGEPTGAVSIIRETSQRKRTEAALEQLASRDPLTGLANRRTFDAALRNLVDGDSESAAGGCVAIFDLDRFKSINDRHGHATGDEALKHFAGILGSAVRATDTAARYGGEEFAVVLAGASLEQATAVCERIRTSFEETRVPVVGGGTLSATVSIGLSPILSGEAPADIMEAADAALYRAKESGRNRLALAA